MMTYLKEQHICIIFSFKDRRGPWQHIRYSDSLWAGWSRDWIPLGGGTFSAPVQTGPKVNPASYTMGSWSFLGVK